MLRRLDEILCANVMVFDDVVRQEHFNLWIADEGSEIDHFLTRTRSSRPPLSFADVAQPVRRAGLHNPLFHQNGHQYCRDVYA